MDAPTGKTDPAPELGFQDQSDQQKAAGGQWRRPVLLLALVIALLILARYLGLADRLGDLRDWIKSLGALGSLVFILIYVAAVVAAVPAAPISVAAAALFGSVWGVIVINIGATLGAGLAFLVGRYFARQAVVNWLGRNEKFRRLDGLTEEHGAIIVALTRLVPIFPFNLLNYGFGLTRVPFWTYIFWTWLCIIPGTILYVVGADAVLQGVAQGKVPWALVLAFGAALIFLTILVRFAKRLLQAREQKDATSPDSRPGDPSA
ncbi:MAG: TVP38/TMEM64 family protein [Deltaproteobacteria bacterium]|nr:TVP38/TMEM64 family protein [Deltaproteobacteria bacterium]